MWTHGQRLERDEVEHWLTEAYPYPFFLASITEREEPQYNRARIIITVTGPNGEPLVDKGRTAVYFALRDLPGMAQMDASWVS